MNDFRDIDNVMKKYSWYRIDKYHLVLVPVAVAVSVSVPVSVAVSVSVCVGMSVCLRAACSHVSFCIALGFYFPMFCALACI